MQHFTVLHKIFSNGSFLQKGIRKRLVQVLSILWLGFITTAVQAQTVVSHNISSGSLTIPGNSSSNYIITGTTTANTIAIQSGYHGTVTLDNVSITSSKTGSTSGANRGTSTDVSCITVLGENNRSNLNPVTKVNFILKGANTLTYTQNHYCAIQVNQGAQIHISADNPDDNSSGKLTAGCTVGASGSGGGGAAIGAPNFTQGNGQGTSSSITCNTGSNNSGSYKNTAGGNIIISSGTVIANGGHAAGIGGGWYTYYNGIILIYGGDVTASSRRHAAGIGSGCPTGSGVIGCYADNSAIISLPPATIEGYGAGETNTVVPDLALAGAKNITYINDPNKTKITVHTEDYQPDANIYLDLTQTTGLGNIFTQLGIDYDLKKVRVGRTGADGKFVFNAHFEQLTTFFTDASSNSNGRPYMPVVTTVIGNQGSTRDIELPLLKTDIAFTDYASTPLEVGYTAQQAWNNAYRIKMEYKDNESMSNLTFKLQAGTASNFTGIKFLAADGITVVSAPTTLIKGDVYYIVLPIVTGKQIGVYSDVLLINGNWKGIALPGYIRRIGMQRVVSNDTGINEHIKVTASPNKSIFLTSASNKNVELALNINHTGTGVNYDPLDVKAKYIITTEKNYNAITTSVNDWTNLNIPDGINTDKKTTVSFNGANINKRTGYYIHWYVESGVVYAHSQDVTNPPLTYGGFGPYIIADAVTAGTLAGNPYVCSGQIPTEIKGEASSGGSGDFSYKWQVSTDNATWTDAPGTNNALNYTPAILAASPAYYRRTTTDNQYGGTYYSNIFSIHIVAGGQTLYWKKSAANNNWNDPSNWVDVSGTALNMVPVSCSNVYIPGGLTVYPSLDANSTPVDVYGMPICCNITFEYGAELAYQHRLTYEKAYIQYNWGYYGNMAGVNYGNQPVGNSSISGTAMMRDKWYALSAPLKGMATGDFAFAGYPLTWQAGFALSDPQTGIKGREIEVGDFSKKFSANDVPLNETNNAIAVKVALYQNSVGYADHRNLEGLKGIIEIPYFESAEKLPYYPGHSYDRFTKESKFFYFNTQTLQLLYSPLGRMKRGSEAYRFIYEENGTAPNITVPGTPATVPGYEQKVKRNSSTSLKAMIGNPFLAQINSGHFLDINNSDAARKKINETAGYQLFNSLDGTWKHYSFSNSNYIPAYQSFIITLMDEEVNLLFPLEGTYALTSPIVAGSPSSVLSAGSLYLKSTAGSGAEGDCSVLVSSGPKVDSNTSNVKKMISSQGHAIPETFFIATDNKSYNLIQAYEKGISEIEIGVKCSDNKNTLSLKFENVDRFLSANDLYPVLVDKYLGVKQNLFLNNTYDFTQRTVDSKNEYIDADRFALQLISSDLLESEPGSDISIIYNNKQLVVNANRNIEQIRIYDVLGRRIFSDVKINTSLYVKFIPLNQGVYIVKVYTKEGGIKVGKIIAP